MSEGAVRLRGIRRGPYGFAVAAEDTRVVPADAIWPLSGDPFFFGIANGCDRPVGIVDPAVALALPAGPPEAEPWAIVGTDADGTWALLSDVEPIALDDAADFPIPDGLPSGRIERAATGAVVSGGEIFLVIDPRALPGDPERDGTVSDARIAARRARLEVAAEEYDVRPAMLVAPIGDVWCGIDARSVHMVVRIANVNRLPGAQPIVRGLTAVGGRVNIVLDPARLFGRDLAPLPCWIATIRAPDAKWAIASSGEWGVLAPDDIAPLDDRTPPAGPPGLVARRVRHGDRTISVLSLDRLVELAKGPAPGGRGE